MFRWTIVELLTYVAPGTHLRRLARLASLRNLRAHTVGILDANVIGYSHSECVSSIWLNDPLLTRYISGGLCERFPEPRCLPQCQLLHKPLRRICFPNRCSVGMDNVRSQHCDDWLYYWANHVRIVRLWLAKLAGRHTFAATSREKLGPKNLRRRRLDHTPSPSRPSSSPRSSPGLALCSTASRL